MALRRALAGGHLHLVGTDHCGWNSTQKAVGRHDFRCLSDFCWVQGLLIVLVFGLASARGALVLQATKHVRPHAAELLIMCSQHHLQVKLMPAMISSVSPALPSNLVYRSLEYMH